MPQTRQLDRETAVLTDMVRNFPLAPTEVRLHNSAAEYPLCDDHDSDSIIGDDDDEDDGRDVNEEKGKEDDRPQVEGHGGEALEDTDQVQISDAITAAISSATARRSDENLDPPRAPRPLSFAAFLAPGQSFFGTQTVKVPAHDGADCCRVNVVIQGVDLARGTLCGSMEALDVPKADSPVLTFWYGEIIDNTNHFFWTRRWGADVDSDIGHWSKFSPFAVLHERVVRDGGRNIDLSTSNYIFLRWKEQFFVNVGDDCGLTIAGFYYLCLDRQTGSIVGFYYDPKSDPFQRLTLTAKSQAAGFAFTSYEFN